MPYPLSFKVWDLGISLCCQIQMFSLYFFVVDSFRSPCCLCFSYSPPFPMLLVFQIPPSLPHVACVLFMYPNHLILRWVINESVQIQKKKKKSPKQHTTEAVKKDRGDLTHANQKIGLFTAKKMKACIKEIKEVQ